MSRDTRPVFWQRQPRLPFEVRTFLRVRLEAALHDPSRRSLLAWPAVLGAPAQRQAHPEGIPEPELMNLAARMLHAVGAPDPVATWERDAAAHPGTAERRRTGWSPHPLWAPFATLVSLRTGVALLALTGRPEDDRYPLACAVELFNLCLFHECHDALEILWRRSEGELKQGLQGLILLTCGYYHQQHHHAAGMRSVWRDGIPRLGRFKGTIETPWGRIRFSESLAMVSQRLAWLEHADSDDDPARFWETPPPVWELTT